MIYLNISVVLGPFVWYSVLHENRNLLYIEMRTLPGNKLKTIKLNKHGNWIFVSIFMLKSFQPYEQEKFKPNRKKKEMIYGVR